MAASTQGLRGWNCTFLGYLPLAGNVSIEQSHFSKSIKVIQSSSCQVPSGFSEISSDIPQMSLDLNISTTFPASLPANVAAPIPLPVAAQDPLVACSAAAGPGKQHSWETMCHICDILTKHHQTLINDKEELCN